MEDARIREVGVNPVGFGFTAFHQGADHVRPLLPYVGIGVPPFSVMKGNGRRLNRPNASGLPSADDQLKGLGIFPRKALPRPSGKS